MQPDNVMSRRWQHPIYKSTAQRNGCCATFSDRLGKLNPFPGDMIIVGSQEVIDGGTGNAVF
jgi:hypothetical protein